MSTHNLTLEQFAHAFDHLTDPCSKQGTNIPLTGILAKISLGELQEAFAHFRNTLLDNELSTLTVAVDGKTSQQVLDKDGEVLSMLNVFVHDLRVTLMEWSVKSDKTNEMGCLKQHLAELLQYHPPLKILTGDAAFAMRPLLEVMKEQKVDYVFQVKGNQQGIHEAMETTFAERNNKQLAAESYSKEYVKKCRIVKRRLWLDTANAAWVCAALGVPNCCYVLCVERNEKKADGTRSCEVHYYISSLDFSKRDPNEVLAFVRKHWQVGSVTLRRQV